MNAALREAIPSDLLFLREMLYEAVFWRDSDGGRPSLEAGLAYPDVRPHLEDWGSRNGDTGVIATVDSVPVGAAWYRVWSDGLCVNGYIHEAIPVLAIGIVAPYRRHGIGSRMMKWLFAYAAAHAIPKISLSVSKDNAALRLYRRLGFVEYQDMGDWLIMVADTAGMAASRPGYIPPGYLLRTGGEPACAAPAEREQDTQRR